MPRPRKELICVETTPYYHVVSRCVRRAYLCGIDQRTGQCYEHRRGWIESRMRFLSSIFAVEICAYAIMSNHLHLVIRLCPQELESLSEDEVLTRWCQVHRGPLLVQKRLRGEHLNPVEQTTVRDCAVVYRERLASLSWFMKCLNEPIARRANREDECTGHFWESRFKSQALHSEQALLACMAYVDLNPVRAGMAESPESSPYTSLTERIKISRRQSGCDTVPRQHDLRRPLAPFQALSGTSNAALPCSFDDYLILVRFTADSIRIESRLDARRPGLPPIFHQLKLDPRLWLQYSLAFESCFRSSAPTRSSNPDSYKRSAGKRVS